MIVRLICVDPRPRNGESDVRVYQVPESSREMELLLELFGAAGIESTVIGSLERSTYARKKD